MNRKAMLARGLGLGALVVSATAFVHCTRHAPASGETGTGGTAPREREEDAPQVPIVSPSPGEPDALAVARRLAAGDETIATLLNPNAEGFGRDGDGLTSLGWRTRDLTLPSLGARAPRTANDAFVFGRGRLARHGLRVWFEGASPATAILHDGRIVYPNAYPDADVLLAGGLDRVEQLVLLRSEAAPTRYAWRIALGKGLHDVGSDGSGARVFADARGEAVLRITAPVAIDADAQRRQGELALESDRLVVTIDTRNLRFPVLLDPAVESVLWEKRTPAASPPGRRAHAAVYDSVRKKTILFGGSRCNDPPTCADVTVLGDTWTYDGTTWTQLSPAVSPSARYRHKMVFDEQRGQVVLFGGAACTEPTCDQDSVELGDTWTFDGTTWTEACTTAPCNLTKPDARWLHSLVYDPLRQRTILYGGRTDAPGADASVTRTGLADVWEWNGTSWSLTCASPCSAQDPRTGAASAFGPYERPLSDAGTADAGTVDGGGTGDAGGGGTLDYGPLFFSGLVRATTATVSSTTVAWTGNELVALCLSGSACAANRPAGRSNGAAAYDSRRKQLILFGGGTARRQDTWLWSGTTWTQIDPATKPLGRHSHVLVHDPDRKRTILFGGDGTADPLAPDNVHLSDTWELHARGYACTGSADCDTGFCVDGVCCESAQCGTCEACDTAAGPGECRPITSAPDPDTCSPTKNGSTCSAAGVCELIQGQACTKNSECITGNCADGRCCDLACTGKCEACNLAGSEGVCTPVLGVPANGRPACEQGAAGDPCSARTCNGTDRTTCAGFVGSDVTCRTASCTSGNATLTARCNGRGSCPPPVVQPCEPFACGATTCNTSCSVKEDCAPNSVCDAQRCVNSAICVNDTTLLRLDGQQVSCAPFKCEATGCRTNCRNVSDCVLPAVCGADGQCALPPDAPADVSGCSATLALPPGRAAAVLTLPLLALGIVARRRQRRG